MKKKSRRPLPETVFASESQIRAVKNDIVEMERMLIDDKKLFPKNPHIQDEVAFKAEIIKKQQWIERVSPKALKGEAANKAYTEMKNLQELVKDRMPKSSLFYQRYPKGSDPHKSVQKFEEGVRAQMAIQNDPVLKKAQFRIKYLAARLDPANPELRNLERLRPNR